MIWYYMWAIRVYNEESGYIYDLDLLTISYYGVFQFLEEAG